MGKPMGENPITHYINPNDPHAGSISPQNKRDHEISSLPRHSIFDQPVEVQKVVKPNQYFLKTWSRANTLPSMKISFMVIVFIVIILDIRLQIAGIIK
jgi:hypothetical protein